MVCRQPGHKPYLTNNIRVEKTVDEDALLLQCLRNAGAIFHVRTNQPQSLMVPIPPPNQTTTNHPTAPLLQQQHNRHDTQPIQPNPNPRRLIRRRRRLNGLQMRAAGRWIRYRGLDPSPCRILRRIRAPSHGDEESSDWDKGPLPGTRVNPRCCRADGELVH